MSSYALDLALLETLTQAYGLPGREAMVADAISSALPAEKWQIQRDPLGNLCAVRSGKGPKLMFMVHMDEVGLIVRRITPEGFLKVERVGGMNVMALPGSHVRLWTRGGPLPAVMGILPFHLDRKEFYELKDLYVDVGASSQAEVLNMGVRVGDGLTWACPLQRLGTSRFSGKTLDDRLGCALLIQLARLFADREPACSLHLAFVVQEETMQLGGWPVVERVRPDLLVGLDGTLTFDSPDLDGDQSSIQLGAGPALKWLDTVRGKGQSYVPDARLAGHIQSLAEANHLPLQDEVVVGISTAMNPLPYAAGGIRSAAISLPIRYHHAPVETADFTDAENTLRLLEALALNPERA